MHKDSISENYYRNMTNLLMLGLSSESEQQFASAGEKEGIPSKKRTGREGLPADCAGNLCYTALFRLVTITSI